MANPDLQIREGAPGHPNPEMGVGGGGGSRSQNKSLFFPSIGPQQTYFRALRRLHLPSLAWKKRKNNACCVGYHSWAEVEVGIYEKKNAQRQEEKALSVKNGMKRLCGLANSCVCWINAFTFETSHIDNKNLKALGTVSSLSCIFLIKRA